MADTTPMRHAKYNERVLRARSTNKLNSIPSGKLAEKASPAPRSGSVVKERPARLLNSKSLLNKRPREPEPEPEVEEIFSPVFDKKIAAGLKSNPFLLADQKKKAPEPSPKPKPKAAKAYEIAAPANEPRPIGKLTEGQRAKLQSKRRSFGAQMPPQAPPQPEPAKEEDVEVVEVDPLANATEAEVLEPVLEQEAPEQPAAPQEVEQEAEEEEEEEPETGAQIGIAPMEAGAPSAKKRRKKKGNKLLPSYVQGETSRLASSHDADLLAAISNMLPHLDKQLAHAQAQAANSENLLDVLRRGQAERRVGKSKRPRRE